MDTLTPLNQKKGINKMTNQKQVKHTALPWDRDGYNLSSVLAITNVSALGNRNYQHICDCNFGQEGKLEYAEINMANAAFIVKAVNNHDKLVDALREILTNLKSNPKSPQFLQIITILNRAKHVLEECEDDLKESES